MMKRLGLGILVLAFAAGCGDLSSSGDLTGGDFSGGPTNGGNFGATQGGVQDMTFARDLVEAGQVPPPEAFVVEGMFSEHDLPIEGAACNTLLCPRAAMGIAPNANGDSMAWLQVGLSSTINPETYERPSLSIVATVDVSGSMGWEYGTDGNNTAASSPAAITVTLLEKIAAQLGPDDRFALVTYGTDVDTALNWVDGDSGAINTAIAALGANGSTNMEAGLERAYQLAGMADDTDQVRVMLFTDVQPNVGATSNTDFQNMAAQGADEGVGLTVFAAGLGLGADLMGAMSTLRGGNAFSLTDANKVDAFMEDNWPWLASPIAYNLGLTVAPSEGLTITDAYGFPGTTGILGAATVFLSKRKGALLVGLEMDEQANDISANVALTYETTGGEPFELDLSAAYEGQELDERGVFMPQLGVDKTVALALLVEGMKNAATSYGGNDQAAAIATLEKTLARFDGDAQAINDEAIDLENEFWPKLLELMVEGAPQGSLYGQ